MEDTDIIGESLNNVLRACQQRLPEKDLLAFGALKTDFKRLEFALKQDFVHEIIDFEAGFEGKCLEKAKEFKADGNKFFGKKSYASALDSYNKAVLQVPMYDESGERSEDLSVMIANRSAALLHLRRYEACLEDISLALDGGYPSHMQHKLYDRQGKCYIHLHRPSEAARSFRKAAEVLTTANLEDKARISWTNTINKQLSQCDKINEKPFKSDSLVAPEMDGERDPVYTHANSGLEVVYTDEERGRVVKATKNHRVGKLLVAEDPVASVLLPEFYLTNCYHCQATCRAPVPCYRCSNLAFCSRTCRQKAWDGYHQAEYRFQSLFGKDWCAKIGHLAVRLAVTMGCEAVVAFMKTAKESVKEERGVLERPLTPEGHYSEGYQALYHMEVNSKRRLPDGLWDFTLFAIFLTKVLQRMGYFRSQHKDKDAPETPSQEELVLVGASLLRNLQVIQCNAYGVLELQHPTDFEDPSPAEVGVGLYTTAALFNHSCDPNADVNFYRNRLYVRANRSMKPEEEVTVDYGVVFYKDPHSSRRGRLQFRYCFDCQCPACKDEWPLWRDLEAEMPVFKCEECHKELLMGGKIIDKTSIRCAKCNSLQNLQERMGQLQLSHDMFAGAMDHALRGRLTDGLAGLEDYLQLMQKYILPPWRDLVSCQAAIRNCYRLMANKRIV